MSTVSDYIKDALRSGGIIAENQTPSAEQGADMLRILNGMLDTYRDHGVDFGIGPQSSTTAEVVLTEGTVEPFKYLLCVRACNEFEVSVPAWIAQGAEMGHARLLRKAVYNDMQVQDMDHTPFRRGSGYNILTG